MGAILAVTDDTFKSEVLDADVPTMVDFWATWCGPCKQVAPVVEQLNADYAGKVKFVKMDVDQNPQMPIKYNVRSIPTLIVFKGGVPVSQVVGAVPASELKKQIDAAL